MGEVQFVTGERPAEKQPAGERTSCPARNRPLSIKTALVHKEAAKAEEHNEEEEASTCLQLCSSRVELTTHETTDYEGISGLCSTAAVK